MIRALAAAAVLIAAIAAPAFAQEAPAPAGPFQIARLGTDMSGAISLPSVQRNGDIGKATLVMLVGPELIGQMNGAARMDLDYEFRCAARESRSVAATIWGAGGEVLARLPDSVSEWEAVNPGTPNDQTRAYICDGVDLDGPKVDTVDAFVALHQAQD